MLRQNRLTKYIHIVENRHIHIVNGKPRVSLKYATPSEMAKIRALAGLKSYKQTRLF